MNDATLRDRLDQAASLLLECAHALGHERPDPMRASRAYADAMAFLVTIRKVPESHCMAHRYCTARLYESLMDTRAWQRSASPPRHAHPVLLGVPMAENSKIEWTPVSKESLRRVAEVFGPRGAAWRALRAGYLMEQAGEPVAYYNTGSEVRPVSLQGGLL